jgi:hypothetical protein
LHNNAFRNGWVSRTYQEPRIKRRDGFWSADQCGRCNNVTWPRTGHIICSDLQLSAKDKIMADLYFGLMKLVDQQTGKQMLAEQLKWLAERNTCIAVGTRAVSCMMEKYEVRIAHLQRQLAEHSTTRRRDSDTPGLADHGSTIDPGRDTGRP